MMKNNTFELWIEQSIALLGQPIKLIHFLNAVKQTIHIVGAELFDASTNLYLSKPESDISQIASIIMVPHWLNYFFSGVLKYISL